MKRQAKKMMGRLAADFSEGTDFFESFNIGKDSFLHSAWLWEGILLWANDIRLTKLLYPENLYKENDYLLLNICHEGRCEVELSQGSYVYMSPGILNVSFSPPKSSYYYPGGVYQGIELCFDMRKMEEGLPEALSDYGFDISMLRKFAGKDNLMALITGDCIQQEQKLFDMLCKGGFLISELRFAVLSLLYHLVHGGAEETGCRILVTKGQRRIVTEAEQIMTEDLGKRFTIEEMASRFGISASAMKKYFIAVYGKPVSQYMKEKRMAKAEELLENTGESIGDVALACGYEHQGKFGTVFKDYTGVSPLEYRRLNRKTDVGD